MALIEPEVDRKLARILFRMSFQSLMKHLMMSYYFQLAIVCAFAIFYYRDRYFQEDLKLKN